MWPAEVALFLAEAICAAREASAFDMCALFRGGTDVEISVVASSRFKSTLDPDRVLLSFLAVFDLVFLVLAFFCTCTMESLLVGGLLPTSMPADSADCWELVVVVGLDELSCVSGILAVAMALVVEGLLTVKVCIITVLGDRVGVI